MEDVSTYSTILTERIGLVERISLNRPEKRNALSRTMQQEIIDAVQSAERSNEVRVIVIRGMGPSFSGGYDITPNKGEEGRPPPATVEEDVARLIAMGELWGHIWNCRIPVIAQVHGYCVAGATDLALHCDMVIAADDAKIGFPAVRAQGGPPTHMWLYHVGPQWSKRILLTGDLVSGTEAVRIGLALESVPAAELDDHVLALAQRIALVGHDLLVHNKRIVNLGVELMGRSTMQVLAGIHDALAHLSLEAGVINQRLQKDGVRAAVAERVRQIRARLGRA